MNIPEALYNEVVAEARKSFEDNIRLEQKAYIYKTGCIAFFLIACIAIMTILSATHQRDSYKELYCATAEAKDYSFVKDLCP